MPATIESGAIELHSSRVTYRHAGEGPALVLLHGIASNSDCWEGSIPLLAESHEVIAPDLPGHGGSELPAGDYSMGAYANIVRDLITALGVETATVIGHSLGGGVAMQLAYQYPERCERLGLVSSGGLGPEVHWLLRSATLPGSELVVPVICHERVAAAGAAIGRLAEKLGVRAPAEVAEVAHCWASLADRDAQTAFIATLRASVDPGGQRVDATDRLYLAQAMPTLIVWGANDRIIPIDHGRAAHSAMPGSTLELFEGAGHFPQVEEPTRFAHTLLDFIAATEPAEADAEVVEQLLRG